MTIPEISQEIRDLINQSYWTSPSLELAELVENRTRDVDPLEFLAFNCLNSARGSIAQLFYLSSHLWQHFDAAAVIQLISQVHPRPMPVWSWDGGEYGDVTFFVGDMNLNIFKWTTRPELDPHNAEQILEYGRINAALLVPRPDWDDDDDEDEEADPYDELCMQRRQALRHRILSEFPDLDTEGWGEPELSESIDMIIRARGS
ncbi:hypothetical protein Enr10x_07880 [Gimesia panareensis]|uniref:Uncharacterized protein n=1 Tax=Gimesia panareensis TaxID=2527978 RepID=A0A517Q1P5_9PLAN|nr:hypothetical protein [Gimesia panareensis]QDT25492.1 hypothetical protein Enr10x_07880 [Gimesia panareensis]